MRARRSRPELLLGERSVTAKVVSHERGPKIRIGKYRRRTGYKRHNGFRAAITRIQIESIAGAAKAPPSRLRRRPRPRRPSAEGRCRDAGRRDACRRGRRRAARGVRGLHGRADPGRHRAWSAAELAAALAYEQEHAKRKGALAALTSAIEKEDGLLDGTQERSRLLQERPRLAAEVSRGQDVRRPGRPSPATSSFGSAARGSTRAPAPSSGATTRSSPSAPAPSRSARAATAASCRSWPRLKPS